MGLKKHFVQFPDHNQIISCLVQGMTQVLIDFVNQLRNLPACHSLLWKYYRVHTMYGSFSFLTNSKWLGMTWWVIFFKIIIYLQFPISSKHVTRTSWKLPRVSDWCAEILNIALPWCWPSCCTAMSASWLELLTAASHAAVVRVDRFVLPAVKTVAIGSKSLRCEPGEPILLRNGFSWVQQCDCKWPRSGGPCFTGDYTKEGA